MPSGLGYPRLPFRPDASISRSHAINSLFEMLPQPPAEGTPGMKRLPLVLGQIILTLAVMAWVFSGTGVATGVLKGLGDVNLIWMALAISAAGLSQFLLALRWHCFLKVQGLAVPFAENMRVTLIGGFFGNFILGGLGGDAAKVYLVTRQRRSSRLGAVLSILLDRASGLLALVVVAAVFTLARADLLRRTPAADGLFLFLAGYIVFALLGICVWMIGPRLHLPERIPLPARLRDRMRRFDVAMGAAGKRWGLALAGVAVSVAMLAVYYLAFFFGACAVGIAIPAFDFFAAMPIVDVVSSTPISVAGLGVREKSFEIMLGTVAGIPSASAVLVSLAGFAAILFWHLVGGLLFVFAGAPSVPVENEDEIEGPEPAASRNLRKEKL